jgi:hypothetical protein
MLSLDAPTALFENPVMAKTTSYLQGALIACAALALAAPAAARPRDALYQWTDATGAVRYTTQIERIPAEQRGAAVLVAGAYGAPRAGEKPTAEKPTAAQPAAEPAAQPSSAPSPAVAALDARIAELEKSIAADEAALADYISDPERAKRPDSGDIAPIADRLPRLQDELRELRAQRAAAAGAPATPNAAP